MCQFHLDQQLSGSILSPSNSKELKDHCQQTIITNESSQSEIIWKNKCFSLIFLSHLKKILILGKLTTLRFFCHPTNKHLLSNSVVSMVVKSMQF